MARYGTELCESLRVNRNCDWQFEQFSAIPSPLATDLPTTRTRLKTAFARYFEYPLKASRLQADVFHILDHANAPFLLALDPRRTIVTCHDLIPLLISKNAIQLPMSAHIGWTFRLRMWLMARAAYVIAVSESTRRDVVQYLAIDPKKVITIPNGVSRVFRPEVSRKRSAEMRSRLGIPQEAKVILTVSGNLEYKNISAILQAMNVLNLRHEPGIRFLRAGGDFSAQEKRLIKELGLVACVQYAGNPESDEDLADLYRLADVFVFPSLYEGFGWPPLEAMVCGIPVVASNAGSLSEVLGDAALLIEPTDVQGLAGSIWRVLQDSALRTELSARGLRQAAHYTWERTAAATSEVYARVVRENERRQQ